ncbi:hypothetical protein GWK47_014390 [Chionoecetes opilio]|uniref:Uncharacterized protein n=1 Tax=Chionoecetes opilio TaxID=41210 RepID=A0A8J5CKJ4_CHIOP|nr:hypothetical protein GWK47_014390 [Chionoecetes opilio]
MDFLMATAIRHLFKLPVVRLLNPEKVDAVKSRRLFEVTEQAVLDTSEGSSPDEDEEDYFFKLCSCGETVLQRSDIMKAKRASLNSDNFERLVLMKGEHGPANMELSPEDSE